MKSWIKSWLRRQTPAPAAVVIPAAAVAAAELLPAAVAAALAALDDGLTLGHALWTLAGLNEEDDLVAVGGEIPGVRLLDLFESEAGALGLIRFDTAVRMAALRAACAARR